MGTSAPSPVSGESFLSNAYHRLKSTDPSPSNALRHQRLQAEKHLNNGPDLQALAERAEPIAKPIVQHVSAPLKQWCRISIEALGWVARQALCYLEGWSLSVYYYSGIAS